MRIIPAVIAVHRRPAIFVKKVRRIFNTQTIFTHRAYIHIYPHNRIQISEITPFGSFCKIATLTFNKIFLVQQSIYVIFITQTQYMKRHKQYYFEAVEDNPKIHRVIMVWPKPKKRLRIREIMYWAWQVQSDKQYIKKYFKDEYEASRFTTN